MNKPFGTQDTPNQPLSAGAALRILVVDDEPAVREGLATWLGQRQFLVRTAASLRSAARELTQHPPDVLLLDVRLGQENGLELVEELRAANSGIPCVILTAHAGPYEGFRARDLGVASLLEKPSSPDKIAAELRRVAALPNSSVTVLKMPTSEHDVRPHSVPADETDTIASAPPLRARLAVAYIERSFTSASLTVSEISDHVGVTPERLSRIFQKAWGKTPLVVINELRIANARQLLGDPRLSLGQVAASCGYRSTRQLNRWFRTFLGKGPTSWRHDTRTNFNRS